MTGITMQKITYYPFLFAEPIPNPEVEKPTKEKSKKIALEAS